MVLFYILSSKLLVSIGVTSLVAYFLYDAFDSLAISITSKEVGRAFSRILLVIIYLVGVSSGVQPWRIRDYLTVRVLEVNAWVLEVYETTIYTLQGLGWLLTLVFIFALIVFGIQKLLEKKTAKK